MSAVDRVREYIENITDWTCLEQLRLTSLISGLIAIDFFLSLSVLLPTTVVHFLYVNQAGKPGFFIDRNIKHLDIYKFRRYQEWENYPEHAIDPTNNEFKHIRMTRKLLDKTCSQYATNRAIPGDPGDYLKEVVGHPNDSGYNHKLFVMVEMWTAGIGIMFLSTPLLLLILWWKQKSLRITFVYIIVNICPMAFCARVSHYAQDHLMCGLNVIYNSNPVGAYLIIFTVFLWIYDLLKFTFLLLYCIEIHLNQKRRHTGKRMKKHPRRHNTVAPAPPPAPGGKGTGRKSKLGLDNIRLPLEDDKIAVYKDGKLQDLTEGDQTQA